MNYRPFEGCFDDCNPYGEPPVREVRGLISSLTRSWSLHSTPRSLSLGLSFIIAGSFRFELAIGIIHALLRMRSCSCLLIFDPP